LTKDRPDGARVCKERTVGVTAVTMHEVIGLLGVAIREKSA